MVPSEKEIQESSSLLLAEYLAGGRAKDYVVRISSGTTRELPQVLVRNHRAIEFGEESFECPIIAYGSLNTKLVRLSNFLYYCQAGKSAFVIQESFLNESLESLILDFEPDSIWGTPSFVSRVVGYLRNKEICSRIKTLRLSGEILSPTMRIFLKGKLPNAELITTYGSTEIGNIGTTFSCSFQSGNERTYYHPPKGVIIEIDLPDASGVGEILASKKVDATELSRYRTGDMGRLITESCPCGNPVTFEILGRKNFDFIKLVGATIRQEVFDHAVSAIQEYVKDYRINAGEDFNAGYLRGRVIMYVVPTGKLAEKKDPESFIRDEISSRAFFTPTRTLSDLVRDNLFLPLEVVFTDELSILHKDVKIGKI